MWTRSLLKKNAWENLKGYYWPALGVTVLANIMGANGSGGGGGGGGSSSFSDTSSSSYSSGDGELDMTMLMAVLLIMAVVFIAALAISMAYVCFVGNPTKCGECKYFVTARNGDQKFGHLFDNFKGGSYLPTVKTMFFKTLYVTLWSFLFIIPGIIKEYEYTLVPYLLAENPHLPRQRVFEISKQTMEGEKWNFFVLRLSFIGWYLLGVCACCIGQIAVMPYQMATEAEFYMCMRAKMLSYGYTTEEELTGGFYNGMSGSDPSDLNGGFGGGSYNKPNFQNNAYSVPNDPYQSAQNTGYVNPNDQYNGQMPGVGDIPTEPNPYDTNAGNDQNNPYNQ